MRKNILLYFLKKLLIFAASIFLLSIAVFCISRLSPGDPLVSYYGDQAERMSPQQRELAEERLGLNDPLIVQYEHWLTGALQGDLDVYKRQPGNRSEIYAVKAYDFSEEKSYAFFLVTGCSCPARMPSACVPVQNS